VVAWCPFDFIAQNIRLSGLSPVHRFRKSNAGCNLNLEDVVIGGLTGMTERSMVMRVMEWTTSPISTLNVNAQNFAVDQMFIPIWLSSIISFELVISTGWHPVQFDDLGFDGFGGRIRQHVMRLRLRLPRLPFVRTLVKVSSGTRQCRQRDKRGSTFFRR
jgi:hypothetical protein